jgi:hypothetical protein
MSFSTLIAAGFRQQLQQPLAGHRALQPCSLRQLADGVHDHLPGITPLVCCCIKQLLD